MVSLGEKTNTGPNFGKPEALGMTYKRGLRFQKSSFVWIRLFTYYQTKRKTNEQFIPE